MPDSYFTRGKNKTYTLDANKEMNKSHIHSLQVVQCGAVRWMNAHAQVIWPSEVDAMYHIICQCARASIELGRVRSSIRFARITTMWQYEQMQCQRRMHAMNRHKLYFYALDGNFHISKRNHKIKMSQEKRMEMELHGNNMCGMCLGALVRYDTVILHCIAENSERDFRRQEAKKSWISAAATK